MIRIVLVDDQEVVRAGLRTLAEHDGDIQVVAEAGTGTAGLSRVRELRPDVVLMDIRMPQMDGLQATRRIVADPQLSNVKVLVLTTFDEDEHVFEAIRSGAAGYLLKDVSPADLRRAIRLVAAGDSLLAPSVTRTVMRLVAAQPHAAPDDSPLRELTEREREVLASVGRGLSNDEIAQELFISPATARTYVSRLLTKLGARDRARLVVLAYETGLVTPRSRWEHPVRELVYLLRPPSTASSRSVTGTTHPAGRGRQSGRPCRGVPRHSSPLPPPRNPRTQAR